jgi:hypothetical protein
MTWLSRSSARWTLVVVFAIGMAWVESASVYYLRLQVDRIEPYQANPLPMHGVLGQVELVREAATLVMLATLGLLAGRSITAGLSYAAIAFGVWDIFYYLFLRLMTGWPRSLLDWDILFLIPVPWWGPVLAPVSIAALMIVAGTLASRDNYDHAPSPLARTLWRLQCLGTALALYVFMADSLRALSRGLDMTAMLPTVFNWALFWLAWALMAAAVAETAWRMRPRRQRLRAGATSLG